ncbi:TolC family protein [Rhizobium lentis]|uniref:Outer membrane protein TolC n=1 Tax=Rhizobium lentis TaxID=1138194 RepID=A0A7W8UQP2_9HYPH|nr:TolC family protein [Rhizobium lentis]MBB4574636.1 outer membrane protein TolC [Rhizobium lentis]MBB5550563.1 outer membrane protein TolC [Rhizobium lentis]MBB5561315.1 outer membrane protein TolC [Rhizobium lentis]MBB5567682.1 outer membrane protein TolC [Rhizobium lentis]
MLLRLSAILLCVGLSACIVKPEPFTLNENIARASKDLAAVENSSPAPTGPISLEEAQARAVAYNLDHRLQIFNAAMQDRQLDLTKLDMLPNLTANAGYVARDRELVSSSASYQSGAINPSNFQNVSVDRRREFADLTLSWNIVDFGLSYLQAKQQADRVEIANEQRRRVINNIFQQVRSTYWTAVAAERLRPRLRPIISEARRALVSSRDLETARAQDPLAALRYQRSLIELIQELEGVDDNLTIAKIQLAQLMGLRPGIEYKLVIPKDMPAPAPVRLTIDEMERVALVNRPELHEEGYNTRVVQQEGRKSLLKLVPGVTLLGSLNYDSNSYLLFNNWAEASARVTANLLRLATLPDVKRLNESQAQIAETRRFAMTTSVLAQVQIAAQQYQIARKNYHNARTLAEVNRRIATVAAETAEAETASDLDRIFERANATLSDLARNRAYADLQNADAYIYVTLGLDALPDGISTTNLDALVAALRQRESERRSARIEVPDFSSPTSAPVKIDGAAVASAPAKKSGS